MTPLRTGKAALVALFTALLLTISACSTQNSSAPAASGTPSGGGMGSGDGGMGHGGVACPGVPSVASPPKRVITMDTGAAAFLVELGLGDRIIGTSGTDFTDDFEGRTRTSLEDLRVLSERTANRETVLSEKPDFVTGISTYEFGAFDGSPTPEQLRNNGAEVLAACDIADGVASDLDPTYSYIRNLASVFQVQAKGDALIQRIQKQVQDASPGGTKNVSILSLTAAPNGGQGVNTSGGSSLANAIIGLAGGHNVAQDVSGDFATVSAETVAAADPKVIIATTGITDQSADDLVAAIRASPLLSQTSAVKNNDIVVVPQTILLSPSLLNGRAVELIASAVSAADG